MPYAENYLMTYKHTHDCPRHDETFGTWAGGAAEGLIIQMGIICLDTMTELELISITPIVP